MSCAACDGAARRPKLLKCLHRVCLSCVRQILSPADGAITCPKCLGVTPLPCSGVMALPDDHVLISERNAEETRETTTFLCDECAEETEATTLCADCGLRLCEVHARAHPISVRSRNHVLRGVSECPQPPERRSPPRCPLHPEQSLSLFCEECSTPFCMKCLEIGAHAGHSTVGSTEGAKTVREKLRTLLCRASEVERSGVLSSAISDVIQTLSELNRSAEEASAEINQTVDDLVAQLRREEAKLLAKVESIRQEKLQPLEKEQDELEKKKLAAERAKQYTAMATCADQVGDEALLEVSGWLKTPLEEAVNFKYDGPCKEGFVTFTKQSMDVGTAIAAGIGDVSGHKADPKLSSVKPAYTFLPRYAPRWEPTPFAFLVQLKDHHGVAMFDNSLSSLGVKVTVKDSGCACRNIPVLSGSNNYKQPVGVQDSTHKITYWSQCSGIQELSVMIGKQHVSGSPVRFDG